MLRGARLRLGLTQAEMADRMGVTQAVMSRWETHRWSIPSRLLPIIAERLEIPLWELEVSQGRLPAEIVDLLAVDLLAFRGVVRALRAIHQRGQARVAAEGEKRARRLQQRRLQRQENAP